VVEAKVEWCNTGNVITSYDQPAYICVETPTPIRLKAKMTTEAGEVILLDDTATNTNRTNKEMIKLWSKNPIGNPTATPTIYPIDVNIYTTTDQLIETRKLYWLLVSTDRVIYFKKEDGTELIGNVMIAFEQNGVTFWKRYYGSNIGTLSGINKSQVVIEFWSEKADGRKYYMITTEDRLPSGNINVTLTPDKVFTVKVTYALTNDFINWIFGNPVLGAVATFFTNNLVWLVNNALLPLARAISNALGIKLEILKYEVDTSGTPIKVTVYYNQDISPILVAVIALGAGALLAWLLSGVVTEIATTYRIVATTEEARKITEQNNAVRNKILDFCNGQPNPEECVDRVSNALKINEGDPNLTTITKLNEELNNAKKETEKWKSYVWIAGIGGLMGGLVIAQKPVREYVVEKGRELYERVRE